MREGEAEREGMREGGNERESEIGSDGKIKTEEEER